MGMYYELTAQQLAEAKTKLEKLTVKAHKLDTQPITLKQLGSHFVDDVDGTAYELFEVDVDGTEPVISGWRFIGSIEHEEAGNIIRLAPGNQERTDLRLEEWRSGPPVCQHCYQRRSRKDTFLLESTPTIEFGWHINARGEIENFADPSEQWQPMIIQVGRSCLKDFLGHGDPKAIMDFITLLNEITDDLEGADKERANGGGGIGNDRSLNLHTFLEHVCAMMEADGWVSAGRASEEDIPSTKTRALDNMNKKWDPSKWRGTPPVDVTERHTELADRALTWVREHIGGIPQHVRRDYEHSLFVACSEDYISLRNAGIAASLISAYQRYLKSLLEHQEGIKSQHIGDVGEVLILNRVQVTGYNSYPNDWGVAHVFIMRDPNGNVYKWMTGRPALLQGHVYTLKGTVKKHDEYRGVNQTVLTRCTYEEVMEIKIDMTR